MCNNSHSRWWRTSPSYRSSSRVRATMCSGFKVLLIQKTNAYQDVQKKKKKFVAQANKIKHFFLIFFKQATSMPNEKQREALFVPFSPLISRDNMILGRWKIMTNTNCSFKMSDLLFIHKPNSTVETWQICLNEFFRATCTKYSTCASVFSQSNWVLKSDPAESCSLIAMSLWCVSHHLW